MTHFSKNESIRRATARLLALAMSSTSDNPWPEHCSVFGVAFTTSFFTSFVTWESFMTKKIAAALVAALASISLAYAAGTGGAAGSTSEGASSSATGTGNAGAGTTPNSTGMSDSISGSGTVGTGVSTNSSNQTSGQRMQDSWSRDDAIKSGVTEAQFSAADTNGDGRLDQQEMRAAGIHPKP